MNCPRLLLICSFVLVLASCAKRAANNLHRSFTPEIAQSGIGGVHIDVYNPLLHPQETACEKLRDIELNTTPEMRTFQFFSHIELPGGAGIPTGRLSIARNPFIQYVLGEDGKGQLTSMLTFVEIAEQTLQQNLKKAKQTGDVGLRLKTLALIKAFDTAHEAYCLSDDNPDPSVCKPYGGPESVVARKFWNGVEWTLRNAGYDLRQTQVSETNTILEQTFPGIYGDDLPLNKSLFGELLNRLNPKLKWASPDIKWVLESKLGLGLSSNWRAYRDDVRESLASAVSDYPYNTKISPQERLCAYILFKRTFSQLLVMKGYKAVTYHFDKRGHAVLNPLTFAHPRYPMQNVPGVFVDNGSGLVLTPQQIRGYNPATHFYELASRPPAMESASRIGTRNLQSELDFLEAMIDHFSATSPAAPWVDGPNDYMLGDLQTGARAIIPSDAHALAFGLVVMGFQNLAFDHIVSVDANDRALAPGAEAGAVVLLENKTATPAVIKLRHVLHLAENVILLDESLKRFLSHSPAYWQSMNSFYDPKTLASIFGTSMFSPDKLKQLLPDPNQRKQILKDKIEELRFPLTQLILKFVNANKSNADWNPQKGILFSKTSAPISSEMMFRVKQTLLMMVGNTNSQELYETVEHIR